MTEANATRPAPPLVTFTPSVMDPELLEAIFVRRDPLARRIVASIKDSVASRSQRHWLLVGPRGMGKTHLVTILHNRLTGMKALRKKLAIAWLREESWEVDSYLTLLEVMLMALAHDLPAEEAASLRQDVDQLLDAPSTTAARKAERLLLDTVGKQTLLLIVENLDEIFKGLGTAGQRALRALLENHNNILVLATTPSLFAGVTLHSNPFYGFFNVEHLDELALEDATELLRRVADLRHDPELAEYVGTPEGQSRLKVVEALAGGHPRIWILFANAVSVTLLDELVPLFIKMLDDLTPYYQERMRSLSSQQRRVVTYLAGYGGASPVKEIARACRLDQRGAAKVLGDLSDKGFVRTAADVAGSRGDRRLAAWELREPLMRLCLDVKESRGKPLRVIVEFLRDWYGARLGSVIDDLPDGTLAFSYVSAAMVAWARQAFEVAGGDPNDEHSFRLWSAERAQAADEQFGLVVLAGLSIPLEISLDQRAHVESFSDIVLQDVAPSAPRRPSVDEIADWIQALVASADDDIRTRFALRIAAVSEVVINRILFLKFARHLLQGIKDQTLGSVDPRFAGEIWLAALEQAGLGDDFAVALEILRAAVGWATDRDRKHLLALPLEERQLVQSWIDKAAENEAE